LWLAVLAGALALWAVLDRLLLPSARWYIRSRAAKVLADVGQRLKIHVRPFQQISRQALIDRLIFDDKVQQATQAFADERGMPREVALEQVQRYAREIVPAFNAYVYFRVGYWLGKRISQALYRVRIGYTDDAGWKPSPRTRRWCS
jgi:glycerol-3-phosphate O-acyltransferase